MSRPSGWYWVKYKGGIEAACYDSALRWPWSMAGYGSSFKENELEEVGEHIQPPESFSGNN